MNVGIIFRKRYKTQIPKYRTSKLNSITGGRRVKYSVQNERNDATAFRRVVGNSVSLLKTKNRKWVYQLNGVINFGGVINFAGVIKYCSRKVRCERRTNAFLRCAGLQLRRIPLTATSNDGVRCLQLDVHDCRRWKNVQTDLVAGGRQRLMFFFFFPRIHFVAGVRRTHSVGNQNAEFDNRHNIAFVLHG